MKVEFIKAKYSRGHECDLKVSGDEYKKIFSSMAEKESFDYAYIAYYKEKLIDVVPMGEEEYITINSQIDSNTYIYFCIREDLTGKAFYPYICIEKGDKEIPIIFYDDMHRLHEISKEGEVIY